MRKSTGIAWAIFLGFCCCVVVSCRPKGDEGKKSPPLIVRPKPVQAVDLDVGLTEEQRQLWRFLTEGSDLVPVAVLSALVDINTGKPFSKSLDRYGFLPADKGPGNPYGLPVGWTVDVPDYSLLKIDYVGVNCSACHTGQIEYEGQALRIDGAPNMADIEAFGLAVNESVLQMVGDPAEALLFVWRLIRFEPVQKSQQRAFEDVLPAEAQSLLDTYAEALSNDVDEPADAVGREIGRIFIRILKGESEPEEERIGFSGVLRSLKGVASSLHKLMEFVDRYEELLKNRIQLGLRAIHAFKISPVPGPGRDDPWGIIRNLLFYNPTPLTAPTSIPHLFDGGKFVWYHADGNTNSVMERNVAQAVALGAYVDEETRVSSLKPRNIWALEALLDQLKAPEWPEIFPELDPEKVERGSEIFHRKLEALGGGMFSCADCHQAWDGQLFKPSFVGTDPNRAKNFLRPEGGQPFPQAISEAVKKIEAAAYQMADISAEEARSHERAHPPEWRGTGKYIARRLDGVWATAPYLHNGSVPTLYDLLLPPEERPESFPVGHRKYDPERVGYTSKVEDPIFVFDTTADGSSNAGHEFGTQLSDEERWDLVEYLKSL